MNHIEPIEPYRTAWSALPVRAASTYHEWAADHVGGQVNLRALLESIHDRKLYDLVNWQKFSEMYRSLDAQFTVPKRDPWWLVQLDAISKFLFATPVPRNADQWSGWWWSYPVAWSHRQRALKEIGAMPKHYGGWKYRWWRWRKKS
jgi:hypothetical protein